ncbi:hypothetical protein Leryth_005508 [Lithospermum erythrorhizon]|nr:hypothetical protein Leryth_005508 [Lithospermum erythrorhizon]
MIKSRFRLFLAFEAEAAEINRQQEQISAYYWPSFTTAPLCYRKAMADWRILFHNVKQIMERKEETGEKRINRLVFCCQTRPPSQNLCHDASIPQTNRDHPKVYEHIRVIAAHLILACMPSCYDERAAPMRVKSERFRIETGNGVMVSGGAFVGFRA